jgi:hypothetical protein
VEAALAGLPATTLAELKEDKTTGYVGVHVEIDVERPQDLAYPIRAREPIGILFLSPHIRPAVLALRCDFPHTMHQNGVPEAMPFSLCVDDRPWPEARLTYTPAEFSRLIQLWLAKAARGDLHDPAQPPDPLFYGADMALVLPRSVFEAGSATSEFAGFVRADNQRLVFAIPSKQAPPGGIALTVMAFALPPQVMTSIRRLPRSLESLAAELAPTGVELLNEIKVRLKAWTGIADDGVRRMAGRLAIVVGLPVTTEGGRSAYDFRAFITTNTAGEIGVLLGVLHANNSNVGKGYVRAFPRSADHWSFVASRASAGPFRFRSGSRCFDRRQRARGSKEDRHDRRWFTRLPTRHGSGARGRLRVDHRGRRRAVTAQHGPPCAVGRRDRRSEGKRAGQTDFGAAERGPIRARCRRACA